MPERAEQVKVILNEMRSGSIVQRMRRRKEIKRQYLGYCYYKSKLVLQNYVKFKKISLISTYFLIRKVEVFNRIVSLKADLQ